MLHFVPLKFEEIPLVCLLLLLLLFFLFSLFIGLADIRAELLLNVGIKCSKNGIALKTVFQAIKNMLSPERSFYGYS